MQWASRLATEPDDAAAIEGALAGLAHDLEGAGSVDLVLAFASPHFDAQLIDLWARVRARFPQARLVGCTGGGVVGSDQEVELEAGLVLMAASLPGVHVRPFHYTSTTMPQAGLGALQGLDPEASAIVMSDPFTMDSEAVLAALDQALPQGKVVGGLISGCLRPFEHALLLDEKVHREGTVGVILSGNVRVETVVAQGCRPVGPPLFVTRAERNILHTLDGQPAMAALQGVLNGLEPHDRALARQALQVGVLPLPDRQQCAPGDFLIRNLVGLDPRSGALVVGARLLPHGVVQFHVRDAAASAADLDRLLQRVRSTLDRPPAGAIMFSCLGRGRGLYGTANHDLDAIQAELGPLPVGGFFCNGEIGPVQGLTYLHGYTSAIALFQARYDA